MGTSAHRRAAIIAASGFIALSTGGCGRGPLVGPIRPSETASAAQDSAPPDAAPSPALADVSTPAPSEKAVNKPSAPLPHYDIHFASGSAVLSNDATAALNSAVAYLRDNPGIHVKLSGYTDRSGPAALNKKLSQERVARAAKFLEENGVDETRITTVAAGPGSRDGIPEGENPAPWNRRVDIELAMPPDT